MESTNNSEWYCILYSWLLDRIVLTDLFMAISILYLFLFSIECLLVNLSVVFVLCGEYGCLTVLVGAVI